MNAMQQPSSHKLLQRNHPSFRSRDRRNNSHPRDCGSVSAPPNYFRKYPLRGRSSMCWVGDRQHEETLLLNPSGDAYGPDISSDAATQITRHALHADQYAVLSRMDTDANTEQFSDAVSLFEQDYSQNESPVPDAVVPRRVTLHPQNRTSRFCPKLLLIRFYRDSR